MRIGSTAFAILLSLIPVSVYAAEDAALLRRVMSDYSPPKAIDRTLPRYPDSMARHGYEGWVMLRHTIRADGSVTDLEVLEASNGDFTDPAVETARQWRYEPATLAGRPVEVQNQITYLTFFIKNSGERTVSSHAIREGLKAGDEALRGNRLDETGREIEKLYKAARTLNDYAYIFQLDADFHLALGLPVDALRLIDRAASETAVDRTFKAARLQEKFRLEARMGLYGDVVATYESLEQTGIPAPAAFTKAVAQMKALAASGDRMSITMNFDADCPETISCAEGAGYASYLPMRRTLTLARLDGPLIEVLARCEMMTLELDGTPGAVWFLDPAWGRCRVVMKGDRTTTVMLEES